MCSGYFRLLFKRNWFETTTGSVDLQEDDPDAVSDMVWFMYSEPGDCGRVFENTKQLLKLYIVDGKDKVDKLDDFTATIFDRFIGCNHETWSFESFITFTDMAYECSSGKSKPRSELAGIFTWRPDDFITILWRGEARNHLEEIPGCLYDMALQLNRRLRFFD